MALFVVKYGLVEHIGRVRKLFKILLITLGGQE
jgi:hypothetical protein